MKRVLALDRARPCDNCGLSFRPRRQDVRAGVGRYCSVLCARVATGKLAKRSAADDVAMFWASVDQSGGEGACWPWTRQIAGKGYGRAYNGGRMKWAHRVAYELATGQAPGRMRVCHECDNPPCCNPAHLFLGTTADNNADMVAKGRSARGERNGQSKLTASQVSDIRSAPDEGRALAALYSVSPSLISMIKSRRLWRHLP